MDLVLSVPGASPEEISRGLAAAEEALERAGFTAEEAAYGAFVVEGWDINGPPEDGPDYSASRAASAWGRAHAAALEACCEGWPENRKPISVGLELLTDPETQLADRSTALAMLREHLEQDGKDTLNGDDTILAWRVAAEVVDQLSMRDLIGDLSMAFTALALAHRRPDEPIEPKRRAVRDAINALEAATEKPTSH
ncbi:MULTISPECIES: hypothetical protein [unclassified Mesorhizobium]|uniref:hypothetical protein n=1 Tax=unclassified Mesorhizobium TaxID=325217 RepID=UPI0011268034|nr:MULTISPECIES: hypothetical protein [unclassified Mesorhizobium]TPK42330.1 hypothetical protein FJ550_30310 [Mesorhizobium sp. B2-5-2]TPL44475.1 hypothetical protein FJ961_03830 [Mesorhizobium sp. B2-4-5]TPM68662.1 hypothetical protein FJ968_29635 [Mesorhizobium sp. B2-1-6]TPN71778.1 hypothetical protein FJ985_30815 [Mesorhizobium sp. B1-1-2]